MPEISRFHGITIRMYYDDRHQPHFHAYFGDYTALFTIDPPALYVGSMPRRQQHIILGWAEVHQSELMDNWLRARTGSPLQRIEGTL
ncbi:MAG: DUF4160 domain-containing protein [Caldilineaceae bacterium]|nr:DUF4160 domain-containing protein [Caldilineaceae bacterium]